MKSPTEAGKSSCVINLSALESIDSAGIGMLLFANDETKQTNIDLTPVSDPHLTLPTINPG